MSSTQFARGQLTWSCHVCKEVREDRHISVFSSKKTVNGVEFQQNVRHCNDRPSCIEGAKEIDWIK